MVRDAGDALDVGRLVAAGTAQGLSDEDRAAYDGCFPTAASKAGVLAFPELVPAEPGHPNAEPMNRVAEALRSWNKPTLLVWGAEDRVLPPAVAHHLAGLIPGAQEPVLIEDASHFLQEDRPDEVAEAIRAFLAQ
jgi:haloalkane dehalogenase